MSFFKKIFPLMLLFVFTSAQAAPELVNDPKLITGKLANGLSYYLYESNDENKDDHDEEISLRLYVKIGSLDEDDSQKGYAHLVEHLGFRDSRYFTHQQKNDHLEDLGLHTNAYTTYNRTVYYVNDRNPTPERMEKHLELFRDFADGMLITESDFELERKIVLEELRLRAAKKDGISDKMLKVYDNGQYLDDKKPIGTKEVLNAATQQSIKAFVEKWYQPQHMHFIVTGQIDAAKLEQQIIKVFGPMKSHQAVKLPEPYYNLPSGVHFVTADDATSNGISLIIPLPELDVPITNSAGYQNSMDFDFIIGGMDSDIHRSNDAMSKLVPFIQTSYNYYERRPYLSVYISHKENERNKALEFALTELASLREYGFNQSQFDNQISFMEKRQDKPFSALKLDGRPTHIADTIIANLDEDTTQVSEAAEKAQATEFLAHVERATINAKIRKILQNKATLIMNSREAVDQAEQDEAAALIDSYNDQTLATNAPKQGQSTVKTLAAIDLPAGKITDEQIIDGSPLIHLTLSNGAQAYLLKRKKDEGHVSIAAFARGGSESLSAKLNISSLLAGNTLAASGIGGLNQQELAEYLGKARFTVMQPFISNGVHGFLISVEKTESLEDAFKLLHMNFYQGKIHQTQFETIRASSAESYAKWRTTEAGQYNKMVIDGVYEMGKEYYLVTSDGISAVTQDDIMQSYQHMFGDLSKYHFVIAGDFEVEQVKTLLEQYIANIPSHTVIDNLANIKVFEGDLNIRATNNPKEQSSVSLAYHTGDYVKSFENNVAQVIAADVLKKRIYDIMRKQQGLTYSVTTSFHPEEGSVENSSFNIDFSVKPSNEKQAIAIIDAALQNLIDSPITLEEFTDKRDKMLERHEKVRKSNASNVRYIGRKFALGYDMERVASLIDIIKATKYEKVRDDIVEFLGKSDRISTIFSSESTPE